jgi:predicted SAM-dependent methyltransferase
MPGYVNVDLFKGPIVDEIFELDEIPYKDGSIAAIHSEHALEHLPSYRIDKAVKEWFRVLTPGGELWLKIPDLEANCAEYLRPSVKTVNGFPAKEWYRYTIYGIQKSQAGEPDDAQIHKWGFSQQDIQAKLESVGFNITKNEKYNGWGTLSIEIRALKPCSALKIGWIAPENWDAAQTRIRVLNVDRWLKSKGYQSKIVPDYSAALQGGFNTVVVGKSFSEEDYKNIQVLKQNNIKVYCDLCESLYQFPWVKEIVSICDKVICCSKVLLEETLPINPNSVIIEDAWEGL